MAVTGAEWERYGRALHRTMAGLLTEFPEETRPHALETADYWISVGLTIGLEPPHHARQLLELIEALSGSTSSGRCPQSRFGTILP